MAVTSELKLAEARRQMVDALRQSRGIEDTRVLGALLHVERHRFVGAAWLDRAYGPYALPIGAGQKMPHPETVALMAEALRLKGHESVLEIGTGSGYQTAILARLARRVCSLERDPELSGPAAARLAALGVFNVQLRVGASLRWPAAERFEAIHMTAAVPEVPGVLFAQLAPGGRLVLPVGRIPHQRLLLLVRRDDEVVTASLGACRFQPAEGSLFEPGAAWTDPGRAPIV